MLFVATAVAPTHEALDSEEPAGGCATGLPLHEWIHGRAMVPVAPATVQEYVDAIPPEQRALFDRVHRLVLEARPDVEVVLSYGMPTYRVGRRRLHVGVWKHGVSLYGWRDDGFLARHPHMLASRGTIRLGVEDAGFVSDDELRALATSSLAD